MNHRARFLGLVSLTAVLSQIFCQATSDASDIRSKSFMQLDHSVQRKINEKIVVLKNQLAREGLTWEVGYTPFLLMSEKELRAYFNLQWPPEEDDSIPYYQGGKKREIPAHFDWRDIDGKDFVTRPKQQGGCGSCWAFSATGVFEAMLGITANDASWQPNLSEQILVSCSPWDNGCGGGGIGSPLKFFTQQGTQYETCMGYIGKNGSCSKACSDFRQQPIMASSYYKVRGRDEIKNAIMDGPLSTGFTVYSDFDYYKGGVYRRSQNSHQQGGHAVMLIGWDDDDQAWIIKNSWGTGWGEDSYGVAGRKGYFRMGYGECGIDEVAFGLVVEVSCPECTDLDGDGFVKQNCENPLCGRFIDCDDNDANINPGAKERCDGLDNDCDNDVDENDAIDAPSWCLDNDGDGYAGAEGCQKACGQPEGLLLGMQDCDDAADDINPSANERCDEKDNDCDQQTDEDDALDANDWCLDADGDGFGDPAICIHACYPPNDRTQIASSRSPADQIMQEDVYQGGWVPLSSGADCADDDNNIHPGVIETCNDDIDNNCNEQIDQEDPDCYIQGVVGCSTGLSNTDAISVIIFWWIIVVVLISALKKQDA